MYRCSSRDGLHPVIEATGIELQCDGSSWILSNPRVPDTLVRRLLDRALLDDDRNVADDCKEVLAARALRARP
jgi:hypothetical protein